MTDDTARAAHDDRPDLADVVDERRRLLALA